MSTKIARLGLGVPGLGVSGPSPEFLSQHFLVVVMQHLWRTLY